MRKWILRLIGAAIVVVALSPVAYLAVGVTQWSTHTREVDSFFLTEEPKLLKAMRNAAEPLLDDAQRLRLQEGVNMVGKTEKQNSRWLLFEYREIIRNNSQKDQFEKLFKAHDALEWVRPTFGYPPQDEFAKSKATVEAFLSN